MSEAKEQNHKLPERQEAKPTRSFDESVIGPGGQIGPFRIEQELGRGAAGVVYLAHDTKLDRSVAIKSLPPEVKANPKALSRFTREARVLASLNHPNIATIYEELQEAKGLSYLVLEYIPGQTLADRIAKGPLKLQEALTIALQIAEAVAAAHEHDVIHRDLKPGNIKITPEGKVKVLDFGLAKIVSNEATDQQTTITEPGRIIGTPAYMSPEQARGQVTDKRCDIWSFGCVLYEILTSKVPFEGETVSDTLAGILQSEPDWHSLPQATPTNIRVLLRRCLEKDPHRRLRDIGDAVIEISETLSGTIETFAPPSKTAAVSPLFQRNVILPGLVCLAAGILIACVISMSLIRPHSPEQLAVSRLSIPVPADKPLYTGGTPNCFVAISPDGTHLVYVGKLADRNTLYIRAMDGFQIEPIPGTMDAHNPFFSPDGQWVGFFAGDRLKKVSLAGGEPLTLCENISWAVCAFGNWAEDGFIIYSTIGSGLQRISDDGSRNENLIAQSSEEGNFSYCYPQVLPEGNAILYSHISDDKANLRSSRIEAYLPKTGKQRIVLDNASYATYVRSGHLIFVRDNTLMAAPFDVHQLKITGPWIPLLDEIGFDPGGTTPQIAISHNGTIVYVLGSGFGKNDLVWVNRQGLSESIGAPANPYAGPRLSPDGRNIALAVRSEEDFTTQVHIYNIQRGTLISLTTEGENYWPQWSPDGTRIAFKSRRAEGTGVFCKTIGVSAPAELLINEHSTGGTLIPYSWSHSRNLLACTAQNPKTHDDIWIVEMDGDRKAKPFLNAEYSESNPTFSPDGRWLAYASTESGQREIYLQEYPEGKRKIPVSTEGGRNPVWSRDGRELYYLSGRKNMMVVRITPEPDFNVGVPEQLFEGSDLRLGAGNVGTNYDVTNDGRFLTIKKSDDAEVQLICVHNWFEELKRLAPTRKSR